MSAVSRESTERDSYLDLLAKRLSRRSQPAHLDVQGLIDACSDLDLRAASGVSGLSNRLRSPRTQLLGLALAGYNDDLEPGSVQILGKAELRFIEERMAEKPPVFFDPDYRCDVGCLLAPDGLELPEALLKKSDDVGIPVLVSPKPRQQVEARVNLALEEKLAPSLCFHGDLVAVSGIGVLILGRSGIGKSDCALDLVIHGHQLVADDTVHVRRNALGRLIGRSRELVRHHMDIRGLGIVNIKELFSVYAVIEEHPIDLAIVLESWDAQKNYALGDKDALALLGVSVPLVRLPIYPGRNWTNLIQTAVRDFLLKAKGYDAQDALSSRLHEVLEKKRSG